MNFSFQCHPCPFISAQRDCLGHNVNQCQNIAVLTSSIREKWRRFPQERPRRLPRRMNRRLHKRVGSTHD